MGVSATGVRQGDPLGNLLYSLATFPLLQELQEATRDIHDMNRSLLDSPTLRKNPTLSLVAAIVDDTTIFTDPALAKEVGDKAIAIYQNPYYGLSVQPTKCLAFGQSATLHNPPGVDGVDWKARENVVKSLGVPIGTTDSRSDYLKVMVRNQLIRGEALKALSPSRQ